MISLRNLHTLRSQRDFSADEKQTSSTPSENSNRLRKSRYHFTTKMFVFKWPKQRTNVIGYFVNVNELRWNQHRKLNLFKRKHFTSINRESRWHITAERHPQKLDREKKLKQNRYQKLESISYNEVVIRVPSGELMTRARARHHNSRGNGTKIIVFMEARARRHREFSRSYYERKKNDNLFCSRQ